MYAVRAETAKGEMVADNERTKARSLDVFITSTGNTGD
jgi:hypothetical protein